jgi:hypothetical protein
MIAAVLGALAINVTLFICAVMPRAWLSDDAEHTGNCGSSFHSRIAFYCSRWFELSIRSKGGSRLRRSPS